MRSTYINTIEEDTDIFLNFLVKVRYNIFKKAGKFDADSEVEYFKLIGNERNSESRKNKKIKFRASLCKTSISQKKDTEFSSNYPKNPIVFSKINPINNKEARVFLPQENASLFSNRSNSREKKGEKIVHKYFTYYKLQNESFFKCDVCNSRYVYYKCLTSHLEKEHDLDVKRVI